MTFSDFSWLKFVYDVFVGVGACLGFTSTILSIKRELINKPKLRLEIFSAEYTFQENLIKFRIKFCLYNDGNVNSSFYEEHIRLFKSSQKFKSMFPFLKKKILAEELHRLHTQNTTLLKAGDCANYAVRFNLTTKDICPEKLEGAFTVKFPNHKKITCRFTANRKDEPPQFGQ